MKFEPEMPLSLFALRHVFKCMIMSLLLQFELPNFSYKILYQHFIPRNIEVICRRSIVFVAASFCGDNEFETRVGYVAVHLRKIPHGNFVCLVTLVVVEMDCKQ